MRHDLSGSYGGHSGEGSIQEVFVFQLKHRLGVEEVILFAALWTHRDQFGLIMDGLITVDFLAGVSDRVPANDLTQLVMIFPAVHVTVVVDPRSVAIDEALIRAVVVWLDQVDGRVGAVQPAINQCASHAAELAALAASQPEAFGLLTLGTTIPHVQLVDEEQIELGNGLEQVLDVIPEESEAGDKDLGVFRRGNQVFDFVFIPFPLDDLFAIRTVDAGLDLALFHDLRGRPGPFLRQVPEGALEDEDVVRFKVGEDKHLGFVLLHERDRHGPNSFPSVPCPMVVGQDTDGGSFTGRWFREVEGFRICNVICEVFDLVFPQGEGFRLQRRRVSYWKSRGY